MRNKNIREIERSYLGIERKKGKINGEEKGEEDNWLRCESSILQADNEKIKPSLASFTSYSAFQMYCTARIKSLYSSVGLLPRVF